MVSDALCWPTDFRLFAFSDVKLKQSYRNPAPKQMRAYTATRYVIRFEKLRK